MELFFESRTNLGGFAGHLNFVQRKPHIYPEPVLRPDTFADGAGVTIYGSVLHDGGKLRMWYHAIPEDWDYQRDMSSIAYAESSDGIHWTKPDLDLFDYNGIAPTNIVMLSNGGYSDRYANSVLVDPRDPDPARRYKMATYDFTVDAEGIERPGLVLSLIHI